MIPGSERSAAEGMGYPLQYSWVSLRVQLVQNPPTTQETWVQFLGWEDPLEKGKPGEFHRLYNPWGRKEWDMTERLI